MCYNLATPSQLQIMEHFVIPPHIEAWDDEYHMINGFTHSALPVITIEKPDTVQAISWGLIPAWSNSLEQANEMRKMTLNAKSETIFEKPSFRSSITKKRCLILTTGFYEWRDYSKRKYPYFIYLKDQPVFCLGGIYESWADQETGEILTTCSIVTTTANPLMQKIHNSKQRMPLILDKSTELSWIKKDAGKEEIRELMVPFNEKKMAAHTISKRITSRTEDPNHPDVKLLCEYPELPSLTDPINDNPQQLGLF